MSNGDILAGRWHIQPQLRWRREIWHYNGDGLWRWTDSVTEVFFTFVSLSVKYSPSVEPVPMLTRMQSRVDCTPSSLTYRLCLSHCYQLVTCSKTNSLRSLRTISLKPPGSKWCRTSSLQPGTSVTFWPVASIRQCRSCHRYSAPSEVLRSWWCSYLSARTQYVRTSAVLFGVPQGSVLGPRIYCTLNCRCTAACERLLPHAYADDTQIIGVCRPSDTVKP